MSVLAEIRNGLPVKPLPPLRPRDDSMPHAPIRTPDLTAEEKRLAVTNSLRYIPSHLHAELAQEFADELEKYGHIYMYRFLPTFPIKAYPVHDYPAKSQKAAAIMLMIMNNLDPRVAQYPHELVTYGGNGQVFSNWAQFWLVMEYLSQMSDSQTLVMYSGHPLGLFPSSVSAPNLVITNGMMVPNYSTKKLYEKFFSIGATMYGQMTAGSYSYIGPQGIVHGTVLTIQNAARRYLGTSDLSGKVFVTSGLGGMSGAQAKAAVICGCIVIIAEVSIEALEKRKAQGWLMQITDDLNKCVTVLRDCKKNNNVISLGYHGNVVDLWEKLASIYTQTGELLADLGSDQTSCHNCYNGGYFPVELSYEESLEMIHKDPANFREHVMCSLRRQVSAINVLSSAGLHFWDYGNAFLLEASNAGASVGRVDTINGTRFRYPSYVQDIMGDIFSLGFGPFRWVCTSGKENDLKTTDLIAATVIRDILFIKDLPSAVRQQYEDNLKWITEAGHHKLVVGSQARILYADQQGRMAIAIAFNNAIKEGQIEGAVVLSRDHHDVSGTDSPYRETSNIYDGTAFCADMAVQNCIGDSFRGATWVALHNGGGVGWGEVMNGGFGLVLDGSEASSDNARTMLAWDVSNGVARRCWSGNENAESTIKRTMKSHDSLKVTLPNHIQDTSILDNLFT